MWNETSWPAANFLEREILVNGKVAQNYER